MLEAICRNQLTCCFLRLLSDLGHAYWVSCTCSPWHRLPDSSSIDHGNHYAAINICSIPFLLCWTLPVPSARQCTHQKCYGTLEAGSGFL